MMVQFGVPIEMVMEEVLGSVGLTSVIKKMVGIVNQFGLMGVVDE